MTDIAAAYATLVNQVLANKPATIVGDADDRDLRDRAEHLRVLFEALGGYAMALLRDARSSCTDERPEFENIDELLMCLWSDEIAAPLLNKAEHIISERYEYVRPSRPRVM